MVCEASNEGLQMENDETQAPWTSLVLLERYRNGDDLAAEELFWRYFERLTSLARSRLAPRVCRRTDPEDVVMSVYRSFFIGARNGRFALARGGDLWRLLASMTKHKLLRQARYHLADRRSVDLELPLDQTEETRFIGIEKEPTPEQAVALADELERIFSRLNALGRRVLELRLQGSKLSEIARETGCSERTVRRAFAQIRRTIPKCVDEPKARGCAEQSADSENFWTSTASPATLLAPADPPLDHPLIPHHDILLQRMIGAGRTGKVYRALERSTGSAVAVKFLRKSFLRQPSVVRRFMGEARTIGKLAHRNIVATRGLGRTPGGAYFIVMELVPGSNLDALSRTREISVAEAIRWMLETCDGLEHAHANGIIHCDLKPANLLLDAQGAIRITDFGLARSLVEQTEPIAEIEGTAPFMAPEQVSRHWGSINVRTDVYGVGAVLYTLLTGRAPWAGRRLPEILASVISAAAVVPPIRLRPDLPESISDLCRKCLSKVPGDRYRTIGHVRAALARLVAQR
jgi:RNA polymerase sigma factor (sigma-70 family)